MLNASRQKPAVAVSIGTPRLLLRAFRPAHDAPLLTQTIAESLVHLRLWMHWAHGEPQPLEKKIAFLRKQRRSTLFGRDQAFGIFLVDAGSPALRAGSLVPGSESRATLIGAIGTHLRVGVGAREVGYWIAAAHLRQGYATEAAAAMVKIGFEVQRLRRMEIHTDPTNVASSGVARALGFQLQTIVRQSVLTADGPVRDDALWSLPSDAYPQSRAAGMAMEAFDRQGQRVL